MAVLVFGPGYLVTVGYIARSVCTPPFVFRRLIWIASFLVQGAWLAYIGSEIVEELCSGRTFNEPLIPLLWWAFATIASVVGLLTDRRNPIANSACEPAT